MIAKRMLTPVLAYCACLGAVVYKHRRVQGAGEPRKRFDIEEEEIVKPVVVVTPPMAEPPSRSVVPQSLNDQRSSVSVYPPTEEMSDAHMSFQLSRPSWLDVDPALSKVSMSVTATEKGEGKSSDAASKKSRSSRSSARLSKPLPNMFF